MPLRIAVQMDPIDRINIRGDSTFALLLEAQQRGHSISYYTPDKLALLDGTLFAQVAPLQVRDKAGDHFTLGEWKRAALGDFDVILLRQDPPFDLNYITSTHLLERIHPKTLVVNDPGSVRNAPSNYLRLKRVPTLLGFDPMMQVVHQRDVVSALRLALTPGARGIFNIGGPAPIPLSRAIQLLGRTQLPVPHAAARFMVERRFRWRVTSFPAPELDFIRYVCMVDDSRAKKILGYAPKYDLAATLASVDDERWVD